MDGNVDFKQRLDKFGCLFDRDPYLTIERIKSIKIKLDIELETDKDSIEEIIEKLNFYTWIEYKLDHLENAKEQNNSACEMTGERNLTALVNKAHLCLKDSQKESAKKYLNQAEELRDSKEGEKLMNEIVAELAYSFSRLGGDENLKRALDMYTMAVEKEPEVYAWKFGLGLLHRRVTHGNVGMKIQSGMSAKEHLESAYGLLKQVADKAIDRGLRSRAYAQLALIVRKGQKYYTLFYDDDVNTMIKKALKFGPNDARVLSDCGGILSFSDLNGAIQLFKQSLQIKEHSSTYHYLGLSHQKFATMNSKRRTNKGFQRQILGNQQENIRYICMPKSPIKEHPLSKDDPDVVKAKENYKRAIEISIDCNIPAIYSLGRILRACGEMDEALIQFNKIIYVTSKINYPKNNKELQEDHEYLLTVTCAYEQSGYCYLDLSKVQGKTEQDIEKCKNKAENKFLKALSFTATLCNLHPEIRHYEKQVWNTLKTLELKDDEMKQSPEIINKYIQLLHSAIKYENVPNFIEKLTKLSLKKVADSLVIKEALESYLTLKQYEAAFAFLTLPIIAENCGGELQPLAFKVNLYTAASRLQSLDSSAKFMLKPLFDFCFEKERTKSCVADNPVANENMGDTQDHDLMTDVLIMYDVNEENPNSDVSEKVAKLKDIISKYFNLSVIISDEAQLNLIQKKREMERATTVIILLSGHPQSRNFKTLLDFIPNFVTECREQGKRTPHLVLGLKDDREQVPQTLMTYNRINLWSLLNSIPVILNHENNDDLITERQHEGATDRLEVIVNHQVPGEGGDQRPGASSPDDVILDQDEPQRFSDEFDECTMAKMSLYCALIGKDWPL